MPKNILFHNADTSYILKNKRIISSWITDTIKEEEKQLEEISYIFCTDDYLLKINQEHLNHDTYTDIITFDYTENGIISSEIYISADRVRENAKNLGVAALDEMHRVIIHGVLHLCGYKDKSDLQSQEMRGKENYYLGKRDF
ncbi:MAG: putative rRNA maturation factor [Flavobacteriales bacterium]|jgi:probable rRNA maturation factor|tara:strand:- start:85 stop:510 length:426 start_codon:yes stop_codon:yes gene_type:complete